MDRDNGTVHTVKELTAVIKVYQDQAKVLCRKGEVDGITLNTCVRGGFLFLITLKSQP